MLYDGFSNNYLLTWENRKVTLNPLKPSEAHADQLRIYEDFKLKAKEKSTIEWKNDSQIVQNKSENSTSMSDEIFGREKRVGKNKSVLLVRPTSLAPMYSKEEIYFANSLNYAFPTIFVVIL